MIIGQVSTAALRHGQYVLVAEHYLFCERRHEQRLANARNAIRVAIKRYRAALRRRDEDFARCASFNPQPQ